MGTKINIAIDSILSCEQIFSICNNFLSQHPSVEMDISEEVMNGAWEALVDDRIDMIIGASGPIPKQKGIQTVHLCDFKPTFVVSQHHPLAKLSQPISNETLAKYRAVVVHDSARQWIANTHAVLNNNHYFYVPNIEYKIKAQLAGIGYGFLPRSRINHYLNSGELVELQIEHITNPIPLYLAWKVVNRGKALTTIRDMLIANKVQITC
ncbi:LysR substrate-binding domain-containing protein [Psychromonas sp. MME2]|uniref:LysR substrate-binding domain-containing protein n=1 Tax=Psychromonas sp. MME2 TaxID=3231033 RepID=UPI00339C1AA2